MIRVSVMYPAGDGKTFNYEYYAKKHMNITPQVQIPEVILPS